MRAPLAWLTVVLVAGTAAPLAARQATGPEARIWFDRGGEPLVQRGDRVRIYYRVSEDAYVAILHIDTDGSVQLVFPEEPRQPNLVRGGRDYRLLQRSSAYWYVEENPGVGYYFILASWEPLDLSAVDFSRADRSWDLRRIGSEVDRDPFLAMDAYVARLIPDWDVVPYGLDYAEYDVGDHYDYPRFLCYDCHTRRPFHVWDPYYSACLAFDVYAWDDPWFYVGSRYRGDYVVLPRRRGDPRFEFKERGSGAPEWTDRARRRADSPAVERTPVLLGRQPRTRRPGGADVPDPGGWTVGGRRGADPDRSGRTVDPRGRDGPVPRRDAPALAPPGGGERRPAPSPRVEPRRPGASDPPVTRRPSGAATRRPDASSGRRPDPASRGSAAATPRRRPGGA